MAAISLPLYHIMSSPRPNMAAIFGLVPNVAATFGLGPNVATIQLISYIECFFKICMHFFIKVQHDNIINWTFSAYELIQAHQIINNHQLTIQGKKTTQNIIL